MSDIVTTDNHELVDSIESKALTLSQLLSLAINSEDDILLDNIRRFKIGIVKKSMEDLVTMYQAREIVQKSLMTKIKDDIEIYPIHTQLDILASIDKIMDRNLALMESILPKADSIQEFLDNAKKSSTGDVTLINNMSVNGDARTSTEKIMMIVESIMAQARTLEEEDNKNKSNSSTPSTNDENKVEGE